VVQILCHFGCDVAALGLCGEYNFPADMTLDFVTNQEIIIAARRNLTDNVCHYLTGGAESETTMRRNRFGFDSLAFRPRVLLDVSKVDPSTTFLGHNLAIPVMLAPIGSLQSITPAGGVAVAKAAAEFGTINFVSSVTQPSLEGARRELYLRLKSS
jgi:glycolate oxidase